MVREEKLYKPLQSFKAGGLGDTSCGTSASEEKEELDVYKEDTKEKLVWDKLHQAGETRALTSLLQKYSKILHRVPGKDTSLSFPLLFHNAAFSSLSSNSSAPSFWQANFILPHSG